MNSFGYVLGIDVGTGGARVGIFDLKGNNLLSENIFWNNLVTPQDLPEPLLPKTAKWLLKKLLKRVMVRYLLF